MAGSKGKLRALMEAHSISHREMAVKLRVPYGTFKHWVYEDTRIPGSVRLLMEILEQSSEARQIAGIKCREVWE